MRIWNIKELVAVFGKAKLKFQVLNSTGRAGCATPGKAKADLNSEFRFTKTLNALRTGKKKDFFFNQGTWNILSGTPSLQWWHLHVNQDCWPDFKINSIFPPDCLKSLHQPAKRWCHHSHNHLWKTVFHFRAAGWVILWLPVWSMYDWSFKRRDKSCSLNYSPHPSMRKKKNQPSGK